MNIKHYGKVVIAALALVSAVSQQAVAAPAWAIGTNPQGSGAYVEGSALARFLSQELGRRVTVEPYTGSTVFAPLINSGELAMGINSNLDVGAFYSGKLGGGQASELRAIAHTRPLTYAYIARGDSDIHSIEDLAGHRVINEIRGNYSLTSVNKAILASGGLTLDDISPVTIGTMGEGYEGMVENQYDAHAGAVGIAFVREVDAKLQDGIRYVELGEQASDELFAKYIPGLYVTTIDNSMIGSGVESEIRVAAFDFFLMGSTHLSDSAVEEVVLSLHEAFPSIQKENPILKPGDRSRFAKPTNTAPYHPGAIRAYKKLGLWTEENEANEARLANQ